MRRYRPDARPDRLASPKTRHVRQPRAVRTRIPARLGIQLAPADGHAPRLRRPRTRLDRGYHRPGDRYMPTARGLEDTFGGLLEVWQPPKPGIFYHLGVDVAQGRDTQADWTVLTVLRATPSNKSPKPASNGIRRPRISRLCVLDRTCVQYSKYYSGHHRRLGARPVERTPASQLQQPVAVAPP